MNAPPKVEYGSQDYSEKQLFPRHEDQGSPEIDWQDKDYQGGIYSGSAIGGKKQDQQNPWQGEQDHWEQS